MISHSLPSVSLEECDILSVHMPMLEPSQREKTYNYEILQTWGPSIHQKCYNQLPKTKYHSRYDKLQNMDNRIKEKQTSPRPQTKDEQKVDLRTLCIWSCVAMIAQSANFSLLTMSFQSKCKVYLILKKTRRILDLY